MKRNLYYLVSLALAFSCTSNKFAPLEITEQEAPVFHASFESTNSGTKTYMDESHHLFWNAGDKLSIFAGNTYNNQYIFNGQTGDNSGDFRAVNTSVFYTGNKIDRNYAIYPYSDDTRISDDGRISVYFAGRQNYSYKSFGANSNTMVATTSGINDNFLYFKNLCGFLVVKLYGEKSIKSITLRGNNGEKIAGHAYVSAPYGQDPFVEYMEYDAKEVIAIYPDYDLRLGEDAENATEFWFCVPPVYFGNGFTITATSSDNKQAVITTSTSREIKRNEISSMAVIQASFTEDAPGYIEFEDNIFKDYCIKNFDSDYDGILSTVEAEAITSIDLRTDNIKSLKGIEYFTNLEWLSANGTNTDNGKRNGQLRNVDLSANSHLRSIDLSINNIEKLTLPQNASQLERIYCWLNRIDTLDVSSCPNLKTIYCWNNQLTGLDVSHNPELEDLRCAQNDFYENGLDVTSNPKLIYLWCNDDELKSIDISHNPLLEELGCYDNDISSADLSNNLKLRVVDYGNTLISHLDVSMLPDLEELYFGENKIYEPVDVSNNPKLKRYDANNIRLSCAPDLSHNPHLTQIHISSTGGAEFIGKDFFCGWPDLEGVNFCVYKGMELDLSQNVKLQDVWASDMPNMEVLDLSATPNLRFICINGSRKLKTVYVNKYVDLNKLTVEKTDDVNAVFKYK